MEAINDHASASDPSARLLRLWGKTTDDPALFHPALYHMLDVGHVAQHLLSDRVSSRWRSVLARAFDAEPETLRAWLPWFIALHDIGKISTPFQALSAPQKLRLEQEGFSFGAYTPLHKPLRHPIMGRMATVGWARTLPLQWRTTFLDMLSGHHGSYQTPEREQNVLLARLGEPPEWTAWREQARVIMKDHFVLDEPDAWPQPINISAAIVALNGFTIMCDWLGSDADYFRPCAQTDLADYLPISRKQALDRVERAGFFVPAKSGAPTSFAGLFADFTDPRPLQTAIDAIPDHLLTQPTLTIIEAPTGEGKTEAALALAHRIGAAQGSDELYVALPTTATSNAMFKRVQEHLRDRLRLPPEAAQLVHGQAFLVQDDLRIKPLDNNDDEPHPALTWFNPKKNALLAPFGVGTVDQTELAALNVRHNALRLVGLAGKVIILDEVHAYDTYMTTIIEQMLQWLAALGSSVILLSATLPGKRRRQLAEAYAGRPVVLERGDGYPYLLVAGSGIFEANPPAANSSKRIALHALHLAEDAWTEKAQWLLEQVEQGGCACWITNTVERAQKMYAALLALAPQDVDCTLLHARFPLDQRQVIAEAIEAHYGKPGDGRQRPDKGIVIGTQVLEQSLDLDFDVMVTDLAPVDLMLQRIGRLHRHDRRNRSAAHPRPHVYVNYVLDEDGQLQIGNDKFYGPYLLLKSREAIEQRLADPGFLDLPADYRPLVEVVYDETDLPADHPWYAAWQAQGEKDDALQKDAESRLAGPPDADRPFYKTTGDRLTFRDDDESSAWIAARTRYQEPGRETITVIPITRIDANTGYTELTGELALNEAADRTTQLHLLQRSVRLSNRAAVEQLQHTPRPALFEKSPLLQRAYPLLLRADGTAEDAALRLDPGLGLVVERERT